MVWLQIKEGWSMCLLERSICKIDILDDKIIVPSINLVQIIALIISIDQAF